MSKIEIYRATKNELPNIVKIMNLAKNETSNSDHFVADDEDFIQRHIDAEGFIAVISVDSAIAGFQIVRIPGKSEDNLSRYVPNEKISIPTEFLPKEDISPYLDLKMTIGKYSNHSLKEILEEDPQYLNHILKKSDQVPTQLIEACKILKKEFIN